MLIIIILIVIALIIFAISNGKKKTINTKLSHHNSDITSKDQLKEKVVTNNAFQSTKIEPTLVTPAQYVDDSIIDITGQSYAINQSSLKPYAQETPLWEHQYIYSYSAIHSATSEQKEFYNQFRTSFLRGEYLDIAGNTNYAFVLLFDLLNEYQKHKDTKILEQQLDKLGTHYPKTQSYAVSFFTKQTESVSKLDIQTIQNYQTSYQDYDSWKLGNKYKIRLSLSNDEVQLLNKLWNQTNSFCSIEFCAIEIIRLYLAIITEIKKQYIEEYTTLEQEFTSIADIIARKHFRYRKGSTNYKYCIESTIDEIHSNIFRYCENVVREYYGHKRKLSIDIPYTNSEIITTLENKITLKISKLSQKLTSSIKQPDEETDIELYTQNTTRWKIKFDKLTSTYNNDPQQFVNDILTLGKLNKKNPSVERIFFEASKFIAHLNKEAALTLYIYYLYHDLQSANFDKKQLTKTIQKSLFKTNEQLHDFEAIVSDLIKDKDIEKALQKVSQIYVAKRKKINLDTSVIQEVQQQHLGTVELLNEYLKDEYESETATIRMKEINTEEAEIEITQKNKTVKASAYRSELSFTAIQTQTLELFVKNNFSTLQGDIEVFARSQGIFRNQLIDRINELCFDALDDVLIEEEDDLYTINPSYYQSLLAQ